MQRKNAKRALQAFFLFILQDPAGRSLSQEAFSANAKSTVPFSLLPQHLVQTSTIADIYYFSVIICFPLSWECLRGTEHALLINLSPAPGTVCGTR